MRFFTIGHGTAAFAELSPLLERHGIATIVDVRSEPWSRRAPDFARRRLEDLAGAAGFGYRWLGDALGGRPAQRAGRGPAGIPDPVPAGQSQAFRDGLAVLEELGAGAGVVLLCAEAEPTRCHRATILAPALADRGHEVVHLLHDGTLRPHHPTLGL
jgi:uncharacterized protein (DUF488 family)